MTTDLIILCIAALTAGFVDAMVGGGGLIQTPAALILLPQYSVATVIGTLKIPALTGTSFAAAQYAGRVKLNYRQLIVMMAIASIAAFSGSVLLTVVSNRFMKPFLLFILVAVAIYTYTNKNFGVNQEKTHTDRQQSAYIILISLVLGFYDGFIGPGAGSFLVLSFIHFLGFDFLKASAHAKFVNLATNLGSGIFFVAHGNMLFAIAIPMAICNGIGGFFGARMAILKGNRFIRIIFLLVVSATIIRFAYDVLFK